MRIVPRRPWFRRRPPRPRLVRGGRVPEGSPPPPPRTKPYPPPPPPPAATRPLVQYVPVGDDDALRDHVVAIALAPFTHPVHPGEPHRYDTPTGVPGVNRCRCGLLDLGHAT